MERTTSKLRPSAATGFRKASRGTAGAARIRSRVKSRDARHVVRKRIAYELHRGHRRSARSRWHRTELRWFGIEIEEALRHLHPADAVGECVVHLQDERGATAFEPFHERELPQRALAVETGHPGLACVVEDVDRPPGCGRSDAPHMEPELEGIVLHPAGIREAHRRLDDLVAEPGSRSASPLDLVEQTIHVGLMSSTTTLTTVERSRGSASMYHENASLSRMYRPSRPLMGNHLPSRANPS